MTRLMTYRRMLAPIGAVAAAQRARMWQMPMAKALLQRYRLK